MDPPIEIPPHVRAVALSEGQSAWVEALPSLVEGIAADWSMTVGRTLTGGTEAYVAEATLADGSPAVVKLLILRDDEMAMNEVKALRLADGQGCVRLLREDPARFAMLLERLGRSLFDLKLPIEQRHEILAATAMKLWRPAPGCALPTGAEKGRWLTDFITRLWDETDRPCSERAVTYAIACAERRIAAHDDERAVLVHGDVHQWNTLEAGGGAFKLVDPDGLLAEAEYDMGIVMREDPGELLHGGAWERARWLAARTGLDATAIWEWGAVERVSTGLLGVQAGLQPGADQMLEVANLIASSED